jgi:hypothetical protein
MVNDSHECLTFNCSIAPAEPQETRGFESLGGDDRMKNEELKNEIRLYHKPATWAETL